LSVVQANLFFGALLLLALLLGQGANNRKSLIFQPKSNLGDQRD
jgi:hypothetical protein